MKIVNIVFPYNLVGGAFRSTYEIGNRLTDLGYDVRVYFPFFPLMEHHTVLSFAGLKHFVRGLLRSAIRGKKVNWFDCKFSVKQIPTISKRFIRDGDFIIANHWPVARPVYDLPLSKGEKYYFIRDVEQWAPYFDSEIEAFKLDMKKLVTTEFISSYLTDKLSLNVYGVIRNGFNFENFAVYEKKFEKQQVTISMIFADHPMKGVDQGLECLRRIKLLHPDCKILLFGFKVPPKLDFEFEYVRRPIKERLRQVYKQTDIFICPSLQEGWHNPPSEAMAAQCAVVATNVGSVPYTIKNGENGFVVDPGDVEQMIFSVSKLIEDAKLRKTLAQNAFSSIRGLTWDEPVKQLHELFMCSLQKIDSRRTPND